MSKQTIVIIGATGNQGSAVAKTFLRLPQWHVRCLTRSKGSEKARALSNAGAKLVEANLSDVRSLHQAFNGAHAIFLNTDFWASYQNAISKGKDGSAASADAFRMEVEWGRNAVWVASQITTLTRFVYSALISMKAVGGEKYSSAFHFEAKAAIVNLLRTEYPQLYSKTSLIYVGAYSNNAFLRPQFDPKTDRHVAYLPVTRTTRLPVMNASGEAMGAYVRALVEEEPVGTKLLAYDEYLTFEKTFDAWSKITGKDYECVESTVEGIHEQVGIPREVLEVPAFIAKHGFTAGVGDIIEPSQLKTRVQTQTYAEYLETCDIEEMLSEEREEAAKRYTK